MRIELLESENVIRDEVYSDSMIRIGSHEGCTVHLPDMRITPQHVTLYKQVDGTWLVESTQTGTPTYLNGHHLKVPTRIKHGDEIAVLDFRIKLRLDSVDLPPPPRPTVPEEVSKIRQYPLPPGAVVRKFDEVVHLGIAQRQTLANFAYQSRFCDVLTKLMDLTLKTLLQEFNARMAWMGARHNDYGRLESVEGRTHTGKPGEDPALLENIAYRCLERTQVICTPTPDNKDSGSFMAMPLVGTDGRIGILYVESKPEAPPFNEAHTEHLMMIAALISVQLEAVFHEQARLHETITAGVQSFIREIQTRFDPTTVPQWDGYQLAVYCKSGLDNVGDVFDVMKLPNGMCGLLLAHATGEPTRVAMAITEVRAAFRIASLHADPPHTLLRELGWILQDERRPCSLACVVVILNPKTGVNQYASAGDVGAVIVNPHAEPRHLANGALPPIGNEKTHNYASKIGQLNSGESLVLFSSGCFTLRNPQGEVLGRETFLETMADGFTQSAATALDELVSDLTPYFKQGRNPDDITILVLRRD